MSKWDDVMIYTVRMSERALEKLKKTPNYIQEKFSSWVIAVSKIGLNEVRKRPGWHDEPLEGKRRDQRSIRLNKKWRAIYVEGRDGQIEFANVIEVTPHEY